MGVIEELQEAVTTVAAKAGPAVAGIGGGWGQGSGVVVAPGQVLTNAHNVHRGEVSVIFADGRTEAGTVAGADLDGDLAVISVDTGDATAIDWAEGDPPARGAVVFALANPGGRGLRATFGIVSATGRAFLGPRGRRITGSLEHTAPLPRGSSGGPITDAEGRLLGINTNRLGEGFYLARPADADLRSRVEQLARGESPRRPRLGVALAPPRVAHRLRAAVGLPEADGLLVRAVEADSPADRAGIRRGDLIVAAEGQSVPTPDALFEVLDRLSDDGSLALTVLRGTDEVSVAVTFTPTREEGSA